MGHNVLTTAMTDARTIQLRVYRRVGEEGKKRRRKRGGGGEGCDGERIRWVKGLTRRKEDGDGNKYDEVREVSGKGKKRGREGEDKWVCDGERKG